MFDEYHKLCGWFKDSVHQEELIGKIQALKFPNSSNILCNLFGQRFLSDTKYTIDLKAWDKMCRSMIKQIAANRDNTGILYEVHMPNKIGFGMKPEEIESIKEMLFNYFNDSEISLVYHI